MPSRLRDLLSSSDLLSRLQGLIPEDGQDLVEYALVVALLAFGAAAGMSSLASGINGAFSRLGSLIVTHVS